MHKHLNKITLKEEKLKRKNKKKNKNEEKKNNLRPS